jgi:hypothetical protein
MPPARSSLLLSVTLLLLAPSAGMAQQRPTRVSLTAGLTSVDFGTWGGRLGSAVAQLGVTRSVSQAAGVDLVSFAVAPAGGVSVTPACVQGGVCESRETPSLFAGAVLAPHLRLGASPLRVAAGGGYVRAIGGAGGGGRATAATMLSVEWRPSSRGRLAPSIGVRWLRFASPVMGARQLILPGMGVAL